MDDRILVEQALSGDVAATRRLVRSVMPIVQVRVARILVRRRAGSGRDVRQEVEDLTQEVFAVLFADDGRVLRAWDERRGLSLANFCGLVAEREACTILRSGKRSPWTEQATELDDLEKDMAPSPGAEMQLTSIEQLDRLVDRLRELLTPRALDLFYRLIVDEESVEQVCASTGMSADAVYAQKSRIGKIVRALAVEIRSSEPALVVAKEGDGDAMARRRSARVTEDEERS